MELELRMHGFVPYQLSGRQMGIQFGHGVVEYGNDFTNDPDYIKWKNIDKTFIMLNGGTTNDRLDSSGIPVGSINRHINFLKSIGVKYSTFREPDLGDLITSVVFLVDERVFNYVDYPDFPIWLADSRYMENIRITGSISKIAKMIMESDGIAEREIYRDWVNFVGGDTNAQLKGFLKGIKLA
jgi:hypothetical protein